MRKFVFVVVLAVLVGMAASGEAGTLTPYGNMLPGDYFWVGLKQSIGWVATGVDPKTKIKVTLLRNGAPLRVLGAGLPLNNNSTPGANARASTIGFIWWTPTVSDIGCRYAFQVATETGGLSFTTQIFGIFAAASFPTKGAPSYVKLEAPTAGKVLLLGQPATIKWSLIAEPSRWPSKKLLLELFWQNGKVGDITTIPLDFHGCPTTGYYTWTVGQVTNISNTGQIPDGKNLAPGNFYWVRASGDGSSYFGEMFVIAHSGGKPTGKGTPVPKPGGGTVPLAR